MSERSFTPGDPVSPANLRAHGRAAVRAEACIAIGATAERVWQLLVDVDAWPRWNRAVAWVRSTRPLGVGTAFDWRSQGFDVSSTITELHPRERLAWAGRALGTRALHAWELEPARGGVVVRTFESFEGWLPRLMPGAMQRSLQTSLSAWLAALKAAAEAA